MPQMYPMSWIFIYLYVIASVIFMSIVISYWNEMSVEGEDSLEAGEVGFFWQW